MYPGKLEKVGISLPDHAASLRKLTSDVEAVKKLCWLASQPSRLPRVTSTSYLFLLE
jgi:hypothetical protein